MEPSAMVQGANWSSFNEATPAGGESDLFMAQLLGTYHHDRSYEFLLPSAMSCPLDQATDNKYYCSSEKGNSSNNVYYWSQGEGDESSSSGLLHPASSGYESYYLNEHNAASAANADPYTSSFLHLFPDEETTCCDDMRDSSMNASEPNDSRNYMLHSKRKSHVSEDTTSSESPKKKTRASATVPKKEKKVQCKRKQWSTRSGDDEESNTATNGPTSSSYSSEDDSHASQEQNGGVSTSSSSKETPALNGKTRAGRGSATDPQSLYARKRRERINERLRILQNLVPNGTKVDMSTMLEEAVQYVKFLQLQIKLLSSDELWMYAPIACNGMTIGPDLKITPAQQ